MRSDWWIAAFDDAGHQDPTHEFHGSGVELEPSVRLLWTPTERQTVWAAYTHALRTPSDAEGNFNLTGLVGTTATGTPYFARFNANPDFASEQLNGYELGVRRLMTRTLYLGFSGFYNHYHDLFSEDIVGPAFVETSPAPTHLLLPAQFGNGLLGTTKGFEIVPEWRPTGFWRLRGSYSYLHMNVDRAPGSGDVGQRPESWIESAARGDDRIGARSFRKLQLDLTYRYVSAAGPTGSRLFDGRCALGAGGWPTAGSVLCRTEPAPAFASEYGTDPGPLVGIRRSVFAQMTWNR